MAGTSATEASLTADPPSERGLFPVDAGAAERRPGDIGRLILGVLGVVLSGLWAQSGNTVDANLDRGRQRPARMRSTAWRTCSRALGSIWFVLAVVVRAAARPVVPGGARRGDRGRRRVADLDRAATSCSAPTRRASLGITVRTGDGARRSRPRRPRSPPRSSSRSRRTSIRPLRARRDAARAVRRALGDVPRHRPRRPTSSAACSSASRPARSVHVAFGAPGGRPSAAQIHEALGELGFDVATIDISDIDVPRATVMDAVLTSGDRVRVIAFGRDQRDGAVRGEAGPQAHVQGSRASRCSGAGSSRSSTSPTR